MARNPNQSPNERIVSSDKKFDGINPFVTNGNNFRSANKTSLDLTSPQPLGGPINDPNSNYVHKYTPNNTYLDKFGEAASPNSAFGIEGNEVQNNNMFQKTSLDLTNPGAAGGPNRSNANDIPSGFYQNKRSGNIYGQSPGGPLKDKNGVIINNSIHKYTPNNTYLDSKDWTEK